MYVVNDLGEITDHSVYTYPDEILVELRGQTPEGEFTAITYQFEPAESNPEAVQPREPIDDADEEALVEILAEAGYELTAS